MESPLSEIILLQKGKKPKKQSPNKHKGYIPYVDIRAFEQGIIDSYTDGEGCTLCEDGDILIVCDGARSGLVGKAIKGAIGSTLAKISFSSQFDRRFIFYFIQGRYIELNTNMR